MSCRRKFKVLRRLLLFLSLPLTLLLLLLLLLELPEAKRRVSGRARITRIPKSWKPRPINTGSRMLTDMSVELSGGAISSAASRHACRCKNAVVLQNGCERLTGASQRAQVRRSAEPVGRLLTFVRLA